MECNDKRIFVQVLKMRLAGDTAVSSYYIMKGVRFIYIMCYDICLKDKGDSMGKVTIKILVSVMAGILSSAICCSIDCTVWNILRSIPIGLLCCSFHRSINY